MKLLDLFCGAGGAAMGYHRAGFDEIVGVDIEPQPHYPFNFIQADAMTFPLEGFDVIHASPPCQGYSIMRNLPWLRDKKYPMLIEPMEARLRESGIPWVIENVMGAKLPANWLCGGMFGLPFFRHRYFHSSFYWLQPGHPPHEGTVRNGRKLGSRARDIVAIGDKKHRGKELAFKDFENGAQRIGANVGHAAGVKLVREVMGLPYMTRDEITQAIPPAYTEYIGRCFTASLEGDKQEVY